MKNISVKTAMVMGVMLAASAVQAGIISKEIKQGWQFRQGRSELWYPATVPGVVHTDLMRNKIIEDPFYRLNERGVQWVDKEDWVYETSVTADAAVLQKANQMLCFKGLDTYADVYLNDSLLLSANNMFREWKVNVKGILKAGDNKLKVYFHSPVKVDLPKWEALSIKYETPNDQSENGGLLDRKIGVFARKAGYHYGWDWGPRLVTSGIWRPVYLVAWDNARIENVQLIQKEVNAGKATLTSVVEVEADRDMANVTVAVSADSKEVASVKTSLKKGVNLVKLDYAMSKPKLWWSNGLGEPYLYDFKTSVVVNGQPLDAKNEKIGIRSLKVINKKDQYGTTMYFELNGHPVFMKGANYIPCDNFLPRVTDSIYNKTILDAKNANMNMLRVWGGGIYENDIFYDLCDKYGILVWQDFMFACSVYPADSAFLANVREEAIQNVKRLRNHPSIAVWVGNNECLDAWFGWKWKLKYEAKKDGSADIIWNQFKKQYYEVLPAVVAEYGSGATYRPSSPFSTYTDKADPANGDAHYWSVWHGKQPTSEYNVYRSRFFSEYGFQSFPEYESVKLYAPEERDHSITSEVMMSHQRGGSFANSLIKEYLLKEYKEPKDFQSFLYVGQVLQGDAIKTAMEAHRRDMPYCMGSLFWQHNDCWPVASWSSRDYYGRWKAQHYFSKKAYRDILISPYVKDTVVVKLVSDRLKDARGKLTISVISLDGRVIFTQDKNVVAKANASVVVFDSVLNTLLKGEAKGNVVICCKFTSGNDVYENIGYAVKQKDMSYQKAEIKRVITSVDGGYEVVLTSDKFARAVFLSLEGINFFEDNYFDILPGTSVKVRVATSLTKGEFEKQLKVTSLADVY